MTDSTLRKELLDKYRRSLYQIRLCTVRQFKIIKSYAHIAVCFHQFGLIAFFHECLYTVTQMLYHRLVLLLVYQGLCTIEMYYGTLYLRFTQRRNLRNLVNKFLIFLVIIYHASNHFNYGCLCVKTDVWIVGTCLYQFCQFL